MKKKTYSIEEILRSLEVIKSSEELISFFRKKYEFNFLLLEASIKCDFIKDEVINYIMELAPLCVKIGETVYLVSLSDQTFKFDDKELNLIELEDMTSQLDSDMYTRPKDIPLLLVSSIEFFELASIEEMARVGEFLLP